jgi:methylenetetrahydrofolate--tRNA-(uracil-5-)-methyltransferase
MLGNRKIVVIGGGLAGSEAAWQVARAGLPVTLYEMRPARATPTHKTDRLAELVCSNSLKSNLPASAPGLLKEELRRAGSLLIEIADRSAVPAGMSLSVDREQFAAGVTEAIAADALIEVRHKEAQEVPSDALVILATGPLTSEALSDEIGRLTHARHLYFYDTISPIVDAESVNPDRVFRASRYGKGSVDSDGDYLNCPLTREEYEKFVDTVLAAEELERHEFESVQYFEACLPIDGAARSGDPALRPHEACGSHRSAHRPAALCRRPASPGKRPRLQLQPGRFPEPPEVRRTEAHSPDDSRPGESRDSSLRPDSSQHLHQRPRSAHANPAIAQPP